MSNYEKLLKNIEKANIDAAKSSGFDISGLLLSEDDIVKKLISIENPSMSKEDVDIMVDGFVSTSDENEGLVDNEDVNNEDEEEDAKRNKSKVNRKKSKNEDDIDGLSNQADTASKRKDIKERTKEEKDIFNEQKKERLKPYYEKAKEVKEKIIKKVGEFVRKVKELIKEVTISTIGLGTAIPGAALLLAPFAFNVPGMITLIINVILTISQINSKVIDVVSLVSDIKEVNIVCDDSGLETVCGTVNILFETMDKTVVVASKATDSFISEALAFLISSNSPEEEAKRAKAITKKLRKLKYLPDNNYTKVEEDDISEAETILEEWEVFDRNNRNTAVRKKKEKKDQLDLALSEIEKLKSINEDLKKLTSVKASSVDRDNIYYDVELPNGEILFGLKVNEVDGLKSIYNVIYS